MNALFAKREGEDHRMIFGNHIYNCVKWEDGGVYLFAADEYTAGCLKCSVHQLCGRISAMSSKRLCFEIYDSEGTHPGECLYTYQTSCMPWIAAILYPGKNLLV